MTDLIFTFDLIDDQFRVTTSFKVSHPLGKLEANKQGSVLSYVVGTRFRQ